MDTIEDPPEGEFYVKDKNSYNSQILKSILQKYKIIDVIKIWDLDKLVQGNVMYIDLKKICCEVLEFMFKIPESKNSGKLDENFKQFTEYGKKNFRFVSRMLKYGITHKIFKTDTTYYIINKIFNDIGDDFRVNIVRDRDISGDTGNDQRQHHHEYRLGAPKDAFKHVYH